MDSNLELITRAHGKEILAEVMDFFGNVPGKKKAISRAKIYLAVDGKRTVGKIAEDLKLQISNVSREITNLKNMSLIDVKEATNDGIVYKKRRIDSLLRISRRLVKDFGLEKDISVLGTPEASGGQNEPG